MLRHLSISEHSSSEVAVDSSSSSSQTAEDELQEPEPGPEQGLGTRGQEDAEPPEQDLLLEAEEREHHGLRPAVQGHLPRQRAHRLGQG